MKKEFYIPNESQMHELGAKLAHSINFATGCVIYLAGDLGVGKTTLVRGFLRALGFTSKIKSPTYTLVETYEINNKIIYHFDLYRIADPEELELIGIRDYAKRDAIIFIEWPERAELLLPEADLSCYIAFSNHGRNITIKGLTENGNLILK